MASIVAGLIHQLNHERCTQKNEEPNIQSRLTVIATVEAAVPALVTARTLFDRFQVMIRQRKAADLRSWLQDAASSLLASFASGLQADERAVAAALDEPWSNGQTEGHITKLKLVKRLMCRS
jgi:transposase